MVSSSVKLYDFYIYPPKYTIDILIIEEKQIYLINHYM